MSSISVDKQANQVIYITEYVLSGSYFGVSNVRRNQERKVYQAVPPFLPITAETDYKEWRGEELQLESSKRMVYSNGRVEIQHVEAGETRSEVLAAGEYSLKDMLYWELLPSSSITKTTKTIIYKEARKGGESGHEELIIHPLDNGWIAESVAPDGTFVAKSEVNPAGVIQYWQLPFGEFHRREDELTAKSDVGDYLFPEFLEFKVTGKDPTADFMKAMTVHLEGDWTGLITSSDLQTVSYNSGLDRTEIEVHPLVRTAVPETPDDRQKYLTNTPSIPVLISDLGKDLAKNAKTDQERLHAVMSWMYRRIRYQVDYDPPSCVEVVKELKGDCSEFSSLMVLLCRSMGMPARDASGLACVAEDNMALHAWVEVLVDGHWVSVDPTWGDLNPAHIRLTFEKRQNAAAAALYEKITSETPDIVVRHVEVDPSVWHSLYDSLLSSFPKEPLWLYKKAEILENDARAAKKLLEESIEIDSAFSNAWKALGDRHSLLNDQEAAIRCLKRARELNPIDDDLAIEVSSAYSKLGDQQQAVLVLSEAIAASPASSQMLIQRGTLYLDAGDNEQALADFKEAFRCSSTSSSAANWVAHVLCRDFRFEEALEFLDQAEISVTEDKEEIAYWKAEVYLKQKNFDLAAHEAIRSFELNPEKPENISGPAVSIFYEGDQAQGIRMLDTALAISPENSKLLLARAQLHRAQDATEQALADLRLAIKIEPDSASIIDEAISLYTELGRLEDAAVLLNKAVKSADDRVLVLYEQSLRCLERQDFDAAEVLLRDGLKIEPTSSRCVVKLADVFLRSGKSDDALELLDAVAHEKTCDDLALVLNKKALLLDSLRGLEASEDIFRQACEAAPSRAVFWVNYASTVEDLGRPGDAVQILTNAVPRVVNPWELLMERSKILRRQGEVQQAVDDLRLACKQRPSEILYWTSLIDTLREAESYAEAQEVAEEALQLMPHEATLHDWNGWLLLTMERSTDAVAAYRRATELDPENFEYVSNTVDAYLRSENRTEALAFLDTVSESVRRSPACLMLKGDLFEQAEQFKEAESLYRQAIMAAADNAEQQEAYMKLAKNFWKRGLYSEAESSFDRAADVVPDQSDCLIEIGYWLVEKEEAPSSLRYFRLATERTPSVPQAWLGLAKVLIVDGELADAEIALTRGIENCEDNCLLYRQRAVVFEWMDRWSEAKEDIVRSIPADCDDPAFYLAAADLYAKRGEYAMAVESFDAVIRLSESDSGEQAARLLCSIAGTPELSRKHLDEFLAVAEASSLPADLDSVAWHATFSSDESFPWDRLKELAQRAIDIESENSAFLETLGAVEYRLGNNAAAKEHFLKSLELSDFDMSLLSESADETEDQSEFSAHYFALGFLAMTLENLGDVEAAMHAKRCYECSHSENSDATWRDSLRRKLVQEEVKSRFSKTEKTDQ